MAWTVEFPEQYRFLDDQHEVLAQKIQQLRSAPGPGGQNLIKQQTLEIVRLLREHATAEEKVMEAVGYPELELHKRYHGVLSDALEVIITLFDQGAMWEYRDRVASHIEGKLADEMLADGLLARFLRTKDEPA